MRAGRHIATWALGALAFLGASAAGAQLLPGGGVGQVLPGGVGQVVDRLGRTGIDALDSATRAADRIGETARRLADIRVGRMRDLVRAHPDVLEMTDVGPAVRGEIIAVDPDPAALAAAREAGFSLVGEEDFGGLGLRSVTLAAPRGLSLEEAMERLEDIAPGGDFTPNHIHMRSGAASVAVAAAAALAQGGAPVEAELGIIDGGVGAHPSLTGDVEQKGFAAAAPAPSAHGTAVASLAVGTGAMQGAAPGADLLVADIYGRDPKGGNALALSRALAFMAARDVPVVGVSLVGPANPLVAKIVEKVLARGTRIVAAVGNDGPAAPPAFPASYKGVIAVTGVDGEDRALIEAGRALHLDYAAPGADMAAADVSGGLTEVRGTSYAVPLVAGRLAEAGSVGALNSSARDLGPKGSDKRFGRGLVCGDCRTPVP